MPLKKETKIMPHQKAAEDKAVANDGQILISHTMGLGKTLTSINIANRLMHDGKAKTVLAVVPASLRTNFVNNGVKKYTDDSVTMFGSLTENNAHVEDKHVPKSTYYVVSYDMFRKDPNRYIDRTGADTLIVDEMHNFRNPDTANYKQMKAVRGRVKNFIGLTGTPLNNHPYDAVPLIDIVANGNHNLGKSKKDFSKRFIRKVPEYDMYGKQTGNLVETLANKDLLKHELTKWDHHATVDDLKSSDVPSKIVQNVDVEMSPLQVQQYKFVMKRIPQHVRDQIRDGLPVNRKEAFTILPMLQQARNVMNGVHYLNKDISLAASAEKTPKVKQALDDIQRHIATAPDAQIIVHSHMLEGGCDVVSAGLTARGISHGMFTGKEKHEDRERAVRDYNSGKSKVIVISSAGATGLNLPNTTMHVALDPHFNPAVIDQIEARGIRAGGQRKRKPEDRKVIVRRYRSVNPENWYQRMGIGRKDMSIDEWMYGIANNKQDLNNQVDELMKSAKLHAYNYARAGEQPINVLSLESGKRKSVINSMNAHGLGRSAAYIKERSLLEKNMLEIAKIKLGDKVLLSHPLYFRIGKDPNNWLGKDNYVERSLDNRLLDYSTFSIGDSYDSSGRLALLTKGELENIPLEELNNHPNMADGVHGNYIEGHLWAPYRVTNKGILMNKLARYFYHGTPPENIPSIKKKGLLGSKRGDNFDNPDKWEPADTNGAPDAKGVFLTKCKAYAKKYSVDVDSKKDTKAAPLIVDVKGAKKLPNATDEKGKPVNEYFAKGNISPEDIIFPGDAEYKEIDMSLQEKATELQKKASELIDKSKMLQDLKADLRGEHDAIALYQKHIDKFPSGKERDKLVEIQDEEKHHVEELDRLINKEKVASLYASYKIRYNIE